ncbi:MAG: diguanylate cyclase [Candidatus Omnitrophica bacterium]|nr:diguanylate cyclase [Candidatus Omnitrophota bacterium]
MAEDMDLKFKQLMEHIPDVLYELDREGRFTYISEGIRFMGYKAEDLEGKHFSVMIHPDDIERVDGYFVLPRFKGKETGDETAPKLFNERRSGDRMTKNLEVRIIPKNAQGSGEDCFYVEVHSAGVWDKAPNKDAKEYFGAVGIFRDITRRLRLEEHLKSTGKELMNLINEDPDGVVVIGEDRNVVFANKSAFAMFDKGYGDIVGKKLEYPFKPGEISEIEIKKKNGEVIVVESIVKSVLWEDKGSILVSLRDHTQSVKLREQLRQYTVTDELTGLYNRRGFLTLAEQQLKLFQRRGENICFIFMDLDGLKLINDEFGHMKGDLALLEVSSAIKRTFRESDILGRIGGDEFTVFASVAEGNNAIMLVNRIKTCMDILNVKKILPFKLSVSIGVTNIIATEIRTVQELLESADRKMYLEKRKKT